MMKQTQLNEILAEHKKWLNGKDRERANLRGADLWEANLRGADLRGANLREANLREANLDFSCWPLWCGSIGAKIDRRLFVQLAYHLCAVEIEDEECKEAQKYLRKLASEFHRIDECPLPGEGE